MSAPTHEDAVVLLKLYELSGSEGLAKAVRFVFSDDFVNDYTAFQKKYAPPSDEEDLVFTFAAFFELMGTLWKHKLIDEALLFDWILVPPRWKRVDKFISGFREKMGEKRLFENFEALAKAYH
jgi:hypothetical protein